MKKLTLSLNVTAVVVAFMIIGCGTDNSVSSTPASNLKVVDEESVVSYTHNSDGTYVIQYKDNIDNSYYSTLSNIVTSAVTNSASTIKEDDILVHDTSNHTPNGALVKVKSVKSDGNVTTVTAVQATLKDAFQFLDLKHKETLSFTHEDNIKEKYKVDGVTFTPDINGQEKFNFNLNMNNVEVKDNETLFATVSGDFNYDLDIGLDVDIDWFSLKSVQFTTTPSVEMELNTTILAQSKELNNTKIKLISYTHKPITIMTNFVPIVITPLVDIYLNISENVTVDINTSFITAHSKEYKLSYVKDAKPKEWFFTQDPFINESNLTAPFTKSGTDTFKVGDSMSVELLLYDTIGPTVDIFPYFELKDIIDDNDSKISLYAEVNSSIGFKLDILGHNLSTPSISIPTVKKEIISGVIKG
ncbi:MAG: hypothetical protein U9N42_06860 [Campylobacterota bacterium]|nr:hypothetical protein [Campylobacterota bacterium]